MVKTEYKRYLFSYRTAVVIIAAMALTALDYYFSFLEYMDFVHEYSSGAPDINMAAMKEVISSFNGFRYFFSFYQMSDEFCIFCIFIFIWTGVFVSSEAARQKETGLGNYLVTRCGYSAYIKYINRAQSLYLMTVISIIFILQLAAGFIAGGANTLWYKNGETVYHLAENILIIIGSYIIFAFYCICINIIVSSCTAFIRSKYLIQAMPVLLFAFIPLMAGSVMANVAGWPQMVIDLINPFMYLSSLSSIIQTASYVVVRVISMLLFLSGALIFSYCSRKKMEKNYL